LESDPVNAINADPVPCRAAPRLYRPDIEPDHERMPGAIAENTVPDDENAVTSDVPVVWLIFTAYGEMPAVMR